MGEILQSNQGTIPASRLPKKFIGSIKKRQEAKTPCLSILKIYLKTPLLKEERLSVPVTTIESNYPSITTEDSL